MSEPIDWDTVESVELEAPTYRRAGDFRRRGKDGPPFVLDPTGATTKAGKVRSLCYGRPSGFYRWIENGYNLERWSERMLLIGLVKLYETSELEAELEDNLDLDKLIARAKHVAGADLAAERGTAFHEATHRLHDLERAEADVLLGLEELGFSDELVDAVIAAYGDALARWGLEVLASEIKVVDDRWRLAGTLDRIVRLTRDLRFGELVIPAGTVVVLDLKTGALRIRNGEPLYWLGYLVQERSYAQSVRYMIDGAREWREPFKWDVDQSVGLLLHLDIAGALDTDVVTVSLFGLDLERGADAGELACAARDFSTERGLFAQLSEGPVARTVEIAGPSRLELELAASLDAVEAGKIVDRRLVAHFSDVVDQGAPERPLTAAQRRDELRRYLQGRIDVIGALPAARADLDKRWPRSLAPLARSEDHSDAELEQIERLLERVEADHAIPFARDPRIPTTAPRGWMTRLLEELPGSTIESVNDTQQEADTP